MESLHQQRERIQDDLRGLVAGDVFCDTLSCQLFASDGSIYRILPVGVVRPRSAADVAATVRYAADMGIPIHARGAGSGVAGESLGPGLVVDFSFHMRRILAIEDDSVRVQPGAGHERLNAQLGRHRRLFGPNPGNTKVATIGGVVAIDGSGNRWLRYGPPRGHVRSLQVVLGSGELIDVGREPIPSAVDVQSLSPKQRLVARLASLLKPRTDLIRRQPQRSPVDRCGYNLRETLDGDHLDLRRLLAGSEGTLGLITELELSTEPAPGVRGVAILLFNSLEKAARAVEYILPHGPTACDLLDRRHVSLAREHEVRLDVLIPRDTEAVLLIEHHGDQPSEVRHRLLAMVDELQHERELAVGARLAFDPAEIELFWRLVIRIQAMLYRTKTTTLPVPIIEDIAVPPEVLPAFLPKVQNVLKRHQVTASLSAHAGQGQLHLQPFLALSDPEEVEKMYRLAQEVYEETWRHGGTISGEHACGLSRTAFVRQQCGSLYDVFRSVKRLFDPAEILNPGKIVGDDARQPVRNLRPDVKREAAPTPLPEALQEEPAMRSLVELQSDWDPSAVVEIARRCNGCGDCRLQSANTRMCPIFRILPAEEASPRAKANLIQGVLSGQLELTSLTSERLREIADLCVNCHMCRLECPANVDVPELVAQSKGAYVAANGLRFHEWVSVRLDLLAQWGSLVRPLSNWALGNRQMRWLMEKSLGIAQGRKLPRLAAASFLRRATRRRLTKPARRAGQKVAYFVDTYANYFDPQLAESLVAVLEHNGIDVFVPPDQRQSGSAAVATGGLDIARKFARHNVSVLVEAVRQGYQVVATEPAAASCIVQEYPTLIDDDDCRLVAENTTDAGAYLWQMHLKGKLQLDLKPVNCTLAYHMPCRLKSLGVGAPGQNLLRLIPGLAVHAVEEGCSGMAGTFGLRSRNYRRSLRAGWGLISRLRGPQLQAGATECSACKIQMEQGTTKPTVHPIKLLALSYGLMPENALALEAQGEELIVT
jgi:FAD/FMN-containing dehydrogenase/Fe-S oxidoreductase